VMNNPTTLTDPLGLDSFTLKDLNAPPHPTPCGNTNCAWQYYKGSVDELFNFGGPGGWDKFDLITYTACDKKEGCGTGFDPNGAAVADQIATLTYSSGTSLDNAYGKALATLGQFFRGRRIGQSFGGCVGENISLTLTGSNAFPVSTTAAAAGSAAVTALMLSTRSNLYGFNVSGYTSTALGIATTLRAFSGGLLSRGAAAVAGVTASQAIAVTGAAGFGLIVGSTAGCVSEGIYQ
jgi:hypothetical protein